MLFWITVLRYGCIWAVDGRPRGPIGASPPARAGADGYGKAYCYISFSSVSHSGAGGAVRKFPMGHGWHDR
jgi:hypothetical protein